MNLDVALKVEKKDKSHNILKFEATVLSIIQGKKHIAKMYEYVENPVGEQNFIVMQLLGPNLAKVKKNMELRKAGDKPRMPRAYAANLLVQMLDAIEETHDAGFIHRDIKAVSLPL